jgi:hypothetical protein
LYKEITLIRKLFSQSAYNRCQFVAAGFSAVTGLIHAYYVPDHLEEWIGYGVFFIVASACQLRLALFLVEVRHSIRREILWAGILGNLAIITMWVVTRTIGVPIGPLEGEIVKIGVLDLTSVIAELAIIVCLVVLLRIGADHSIITNNDEIPV